LKQILLLLAGCLPTLAIFSQHDSLLKKFKYRIDQFRAVSFNGGGGSQYQQRVLSSGETINNSSSVNLGGTYFALKSTDLQLLTVSAYVGTHFYRNKNIQPSSSKRNSSFSISPCTSILNKWFTRHRFLELGADINASYNHNKETTASLPGKQIAHGYSFQLNTGIGSGRLENITDMQNAMWLNKALASVNRLSRVLTADELNGLGRAITRANNTRVLDQRKRTQFVLTTVDGYLQQQDLVNTTDINYFSNLNDILFFAFNNPRLSGTEKFIRFTPSVNGSGRDDSGTGASSASKYQDRFTTTSLTISTGINKYIPTNLVHQNNYGASIQASYGTRDVLVRFYNSGGGVNETKYNFIGRLASINAFYTHAIYPNTRTTIAGNFQSEFGYQSNDDSQYTFGRTSIDATLNYFISYRTRLTATIGAEYQKNAYRTFQAMTGVPENTRLYANGGIEINL